MHTIEAMGLERAVARINEFQSTLNPGNWQLATILAELAASGDSLVGYHRD